MAAENLPRPCHAILRCSKVGWVGVALFVLSAGGLLTQGVHSGEMNELHQLAHALGREPRIKDSRHFVVAFGVIATPFPGDEPSLHFARCSQERRSPSPVPTTSRADSTT